MKGTILVDVQEYITGISLIEGDLLKEEYVEYKNADAITGNIYCGKVVNVLHGLQSAFVDIGRERNGFLSVEETMDHKSVLRDAIDKQINAKSGDYILVQATKEEIGTKGARLTTNISLAGRYVVFLPTLDFVGVSNKITDENTRQRLTQLLNDNKQPQTGLIARTICLEATEQEIINEIGQLVQLWEKILKNFNNRKRICKIYDDGNLVFRTVRDILSDQIQEVICNDIEECENLRKKVSDFKPHYVDKIKYYNEPTDMLKKYGILDKIDELLRKKIKLPSGGSLVFDYTEALTVIDVNTARYAGITNHEESVFNTNMEAATEIARQIRLRNIGGIIIIDFIDMLNESHKEKVMARLYEEMLFDRVKTRIVGMTNLGLVEVTRKKSGRELSTILLDKCAHCNGNALTYSNDYLCRKIKSELTDVFNDNNVVGATINVHRSLAEHMSVSSFFDSVCNNEWTGKKIYVVPQNALSSVDFKITPLTKETHVVPPNAITLY